MGRYLSFVSSTIKPSGYWWVTAAYRGKRDGEVKDLGNWALEIRESNMIEKDRTYENTFLKGAAPNGHCLR